MRFALLLLTALVSTGCETITPIAMQGPNGRPAYSMECSGMTRSITDCYKKASELCPGGYNVIDRPQRVIAFQGMASTHEGLIVECK